MKFICIISPDPAYQAEILFEGTRNHSFAYSGAHFNWDGGGPIEGIIKAEATLFRVHDEDVSRAVEQLTRIRPNHEVYVLSEERVFIRPSGPMIEKRITKDGILPV